MSLHLHFIYSICSTYRTASRRVLDSHTQVYWSLVHWCKCEAKIKFIMTIITDVSVRVGWLVLSLASDILISIWKSIRISMWKIHWQAVEWTTERPTRHCTGVSAIHVYNVIMNSFVCTVHTQQNDGKKSANSTWTARRFLAIWLPSSRLVFTAAKPSRLLYNLLLILMIIFRM